MCALLCSLPFSLFFFLNDTATTEIYTLSLHDALPISTLFGALVVPVAAAMVGFGGQVPLDRKSTRLNSSHITISYAVFCLKKKIRPTHRSRPDKKLCQC